MFDELALGMLFDECLQGRRVGLAPLRCRLAELELGGLGVGDSRLEILVGVGALFPLGVEGDDLLVEFLGLRLQCGREPAAAFFGELEDDFDVLGLFGEALAQGEVSVDAGDRLLDLFQEFVGRGSVADDPVDLFPVLVDEELRGRRVDVVLLVDGVAVLVAAAGAIEDDVLVEEIGVFGVVVELLNQQFAGPSATRVEVDEDEFVLFLGLGQRLVKGSGEDRGRLGGGEGGDEEEAGDNGEFLHAALLGMRCLFPLSIYNPAMECNPPPSSFLYTPQGWQRLRRAANIPRRRRPPFP